MSRIVHRATLWSPRAATVALTDRRPREIIVQLAEGMDVELWPGAEDHAQQVAWIDAALAQLHQARRLMVEHPGVGEVDQ